MQLITQKKGAMSGPQSRRQRINPRSKQNLPKPSVNTDIIDINKWPPIRRVLITIKTC